MQLKGLVRFFAIALIIISLYQLSFTWFVRNHEKKMEAKATEWLKANYPKADSKYPGNKELQELYQDTLNSLKQARLRRLLDSTKDVTVTYGVQGAISYQKAKESELNLGLDLQGGMNVTLEVALDGLLRSMANNSKETAFNQALENATARKANSDADYITLFAEEYKKLNPNGKLAALFANQKNKSLKATSSDEEVLKVIREESGNAINRTYNVITTRIDQFGVAQPNISLDKNKGIINVELAGINDPERVRTYLQSTANLQFWEVYNIGELNASLEAADAALRAHLNGAKPAEVAKSTTDSTTAKATNDSSKNLSDVLAKADTQKGKAKDSLAAAAQQGLGTYIAFLPPQQDEKGITRFPSNVGYVATKDTSLVRSYLNLPAVAGAFPANTRFLYGVPEKDKEGKRQNFVPLYAIKTVPGTDRAILEGEHVVEAAQDFDGMNNQVTVNMSMDKVGERIWAKMTGDNVGRPIAISLDDLVYSAPNVNEAITGGNSRITGNFTVQEAQDLSNILKAGKLPAPAKIVQEQVVGPTLGEESIKGGAMAFALSFIVIFALMLVYYNTSGWVANIALILNLLFTIGVLSALGATLTAAGIAGLVLSIGMAVDTNVIIFERIKDELNSGKSYANAVSAGYQRSLAPVLDAHITTLLTAVILFYFGLGPIKGFATTQIIAILLNLFCGILVSRLISEWWTNSKGRHLEYFTGISRRIFKHAQYKFIEYRKVAYAISAVVLALGIASFFNGFDQGVEFAGGRSYTIRFEKPVNVEAVRADLAKSFGEAPVMKTIGGNNQLDITTAYLIDKTGPEVDSIVRTKLFEGLKNYLPAGTSYADFKSTKFTAGTKTVLPTISDDLKNGAKWATFFSLLAISLYIFIRFRDWRYSVGTIVALLHDVLVTLAVFSFARNWVSFPLEVDQHFIAAILTVIGFSMNDTIIVFDRVREYSHKMSGADNGTIINRAINETLSRTIMTSLTVFLTILILFLVGGEVTKGFAFAMLIGVVTGTYSSIFVAAPILVDFAKGKKLGKEEKV